MRYLGTYGAAALPNHKLVRYSAYGTSGSDKNDKENRIQHYGNRYDKRILYVTLRQTTLRSIIVRPITTRRNPTRFRSDTVPFLQLATTAYGSRAPIRYTKTKCRHEPCILLIYRIFNCRGAYMQHRCPSMARCITIQNRTHRGYRTGGA